MYNTCTPFYHLILAYETGLSDPHFVLGVLSFRDIDLLFETEMLECFMPKPITKVYERTR